VKDRRFVAFGLEKKRNAEKLLGRLELLAVAKIDRGGLVSLSLDEDDPRLSSLLAELRRRGIRTFTRVDRVWSKKELDLAPWLHLRVATAGLAGGNGYGQEYDRSGACEECGAGAIPIPPLVADLPRMGKKHLDATARDGLLVVSAGVADAIGDAALTGVELLPVRSRSPRYPTEGHRWLRIDSVLPRLAPSSVVQVSDPCPRCGRSGRYDSLDHATELRYEDLRDACDFNLTWEYWGVWNGPLPADRVGGAQAPVVSERVRQCFLRSGVRHVEYEPVGVGPATP
jgi:hypothetical protein